jgi:hypothetical protein
VLRLHIVWKVVINILEKHTTSIFKEDDHIMNLHNPENHKSHMEDKYLIFVLFNDTFSAATASNGNRFWTNWERCERRRSWPFFNPLKLSGYYIYLPL